MILDIQEDKEGVI